MTIEVADARETAVLDALRGVIDPEIGINIVDLGLVYDVVIDGGGVAVQMTMTTPSCPLGPMIREQAEDAIRAALPDVDRVAVEIVWDPPWSHDMMSPEARQRLGVP